MKRIAMLAVSVSAALFAAGCGKAHDDREAGQDLHQLSHEAVTDVNHAVRDAEHDVKDLSRDVNAATIGAETEVRQAALQVRNDLRAQPEVRQVLHDNDAGRPAEPAQLRQEITRDAVDAAGAAAEGAAEKLFNKIK